MRDEEYFQLSKRGVFGFIYGFLFWGGIGFIVLCFGALIWFGMYREVMVGLIGTGVVVALLLIRNFFEDNTWEAKMKRLMKNPQVQMLGRTHRDTQEVLSPGYPDAGKAGLYKHIDMILFFIWDPIGINYDEGDPWVQSNPDDLPRDEYYSYVPLVYDFLKTKPGKEKIKVFLENTMAQYMIKPTAQQKEQCAKTAEKLAELQVE